MKLNTISRLALALSAALLIVGCSRSAPSPAAQAAPVLGTSTLQAAGVCLPRQCGRVPICTGNSVARCSTDTNCRWTCVPLIGPI